MLTRFLARRLLLFLSILNAGCTDNPIPPTRASATTATPASIALTATIVDSGLPPTAVIVATVRNSAGTFVSGVTVNFSTTSGFITSGTQTGTDGAAVAMLTGTTGTSPTVTASVAASDKETITETTVVHF